MTQALFFQLAVLLHRFPVWLSWHGMANIAHLCYSGNMKRIPLKRKSKTPLAKAKEKLWKLCRAIIIKRHGNTCYTCGKKNLSGSGLHVGHFISSSICSTTLRYDLQNLRPQCYACNIHRSGNWVAYEAHLKRDGIDVEKLKTHNEATKGEKYDISWYEQKIEEYERL